MYVEYHIRYIKLIIYLYAQENAYDFKFQGDFSLFKAQLSQYLCSCLDLIVNLEIIDKDAKEVNEATEAREARESRKML